MEDKNTVLADILEDFEKRIAALELQLKDGKTITCDTNFTLKDGVNIDEIAKSLHDIYTNNLIEKNNKSI